MAVVWRGLFGPEERRRLDISGWFSLLVIALWIICRLTPQLSGYWPWAAVGTLVLSGILMLRSSGKCPCTTLAHVGGVGLLSGIIWPHLQWLPVAGASLLLLTSMKASFGSGIRFELAKVSGDVILFAGSIGASTWYMWLAHVAPSAANGNKVSQLKFAVLALLLVSHLTVSVAFFSRLQEKDWKEYLVKFTGGSLLTSGFGVLTLPQSAPNAHEMHGLLLALGTLLVARPVLGTGLPFDRRGLSREAILGPWHLFGPTLVVLAPLACFSHSLINGATVSAMNGLFVGLAFAGAAILWRQVLAVNENAMLYKEAVSALGRIREQAKLLSDRNTELERLMSENKVLAEAKSAAESANRMLRDLATVDATTGLPNRRMFQAALTEAQDAYSTQGQPYSVVVFDIDYFKQYNDSFGHPAGDDVLRRTGDLLLGMANKQRLCARYGGEEFIILLQGPEAEKTALFAESAREAIEAMSGLKRHVTASFGWAHSHEGDALVDMADMALYQAKRTGRNKVVAYSDLPREPEEAKQSATTIGSDADRDILKLTCKLQGWSAGSASAELLRTVDSLFRARFGTESSGIDRAAWCGLRLALELTARKPETAEKTLFSKLALGGLLHDLGTIGIPESILGKTGKLNDQEWDVVRRHPDLAVPQIKRLPQFHLAYQVVKHHHERWDGAGYPDGISGDLIPLEARIFAVADAFEAIVCGRSYRPAKMIVEAKDELLAESGLQFDPLVIQAFLGVPASDWNRIFSGDVTWLAESVLARQESSGSVAA